MGAGLRQVSCLPLGAGAWLRYNACLAAHELPYVQCCSLRALPHTGVSRAQLGVRQVRPAPAA